MEKWQMIIDVGKCEDCNNCFLACKDEHMDNDWPGYAVSQPRHGNRWMNIQRKERGEYPHIDVAYRPTPCMHCKEAPCVKFAIDAGKLGAVYKREDGIVIIDPKETKGMKELVKACPYGVIFWNEEADLPQKCTFCAHLLDKGWKEPRCVQACPTGALKVVKAESGEMERLVINEGLTVLKPELKTEPHVYYKNLKRFETCFIAGSVAYEKDGLMECAAGARVHLTKDGDPVAAVKADTFGDFKIDGIRENSGTFQVVVTFGSVREKQLEVKVAGGSVSLGTIVL
jgi:Fe-S-cluster-containing dehydrogenase component